MKEFDNNYAPAFCEERSAYRRYAGGFRSRRRNGSASQMKKAYFSSTMRRLHALVLDTESGLDALDFADEEIYCCIGHGKFAVEAISFVIPISSLIRRAGSTALPPVKSPQRQRDYRSAAADEAEIVLEHYAMAHDLEHIREKIRSCQIFVRKRTEFFAGSSVFMRKEAQACFEVSLSFRRMGIGTELENYIQTISLTGLDALRSGLFNQRCIAQYAVEARLCRFG